MIKSQKLLCGSCLYKQDRLVSYSKLLFYTYERYTNDLCLPNIDLNNLPNCFFSQVNVHMPKDRVTQQHQGYGFVEFLGEEDADYAIKIMNMIKVHGKPIRVNKVRNFLWFMYLIIYKQ